MSSRKCRTQRPGRVGGGLGPGVETPGRPIRANNPNCDNFLTSARGGWYPTRTMVVKRILQVVVGLIAAGLIALLLVSDLHPAGWDRAAGLEAELDTLQQENALLRARNVELSRVVSVPQDDQVWMEKIIREDLGYVREGEVIVVLPN